MNTALRSRVNYRQRGFTIVELLIVIVVIAILAAITIVAYNGIQQRAHASAAQSALTQASKKLALYQVDNGGYPSELATAGIQESGDVTYQYSFDNEANAQTFCITATAGNISYKVTESTPPTAGGCPGHGQGGQVAVTNLLTNPSFETDVAGWSGLHATVASVTSPWSLDGHAIKVTPTGQDSFAQTSIPVQAGKTYTILATIHLESALAGTLKGPMQTRNPMATFYDSGGAYLGTGGGTSAPSTNAAGTYTHRITTTAPASATQLRLRLYNGANTGGGSVYWDQVMVIEGNYSGAYGDGASTSWVWNGTPNSSTSTGPTP